MSFSKKVKNSVKKAVSWIGNFEQTAAELAIEQGYDYVICGHIHQPQKRMVTNEHGSVMYLNREIFQKAEILSEPILQESKSVISELSILKNIVVEFLNKKSFTLLS